MQKGTAFDDKEYENIGEKRKEKMYSPILDMAGDAATHPLSNKKKKIKGKSNRKK